MRLLDRGRRRKGRQVLVIVKVQFIFILLAALVITNVLLNAHKTCRQGCSLLEEKGLMVLFVCCLAELRPERTIYNCATSIFKKKGKCSEELLRQAKKVG